MISEIKNYASRFTNKMQNQSKQNIIEIPNELDEVLQVTENECDEFIVYDFPKSATTTTSTTTNTRRSLHLPSLLPKSPFIQFLGILVLLLLYVLLNIWIMKPYFADIEKYRAEVRINAKLSDNDLVEMALREPGIRPPHSLDPKDIEDAAHHLTAVYMKLAEKRKEAASKVANSPDVELEFIILVSSLAILLASCYFIK